MGIYFNLNSPVFGFPQDKSQIEIELGRLNTAITKTINSKMGRDHTLTSSLIQTTEEEANELFKNLQAELRKQLPRWVWPAFVRGLVVCGICAMLFSEATSIICGILFTVISYVSIALSHIMLYRKPFLETFQTNVNSLLLLICKPENQQELQELYSLLNKYLKQEKSNIVFTASHATLELEIE